MVWGDARSVTRMESGVRGELVNVGNGRGGGGDDDDDGGEIKGREQGGSGIACHCPLACI